MKIVAKRGSMQYIVTDGEGINPPGHIVDLRQNSATAMPIQQALKWGYWEEPGDVPVDVEQRISSLVNQSDNKISTLIGLLAK